MAEDQDFSNLQDAFTDFATNSLTEDIPDTVFNVVKIGFAAGCLATNSIIKMILEDLTAQALQMSLDGFGKPESLQAQASVASIRQMIEEYKRGTH